MNSLKQEIIDELKIVSNDCLIDSRKELLESFYNCKDVGGTAELLDLIVEIENELEGRGVRYEKNNIRVYNRNSSSNTDNK